MIEIGGGLILGFLLGYALQRGGFCMNTAFRSIVFEKDRTLLRAWAVVVLINVIGVNLLAELRVLRPSSAPLFWPALIIGGIVFGIGMVLAGGCASGTCYRAGRGMLGSCAALIGFLIGTTAMDGGAFAGIQSSLRTPTIDIAGQEATLFNLLGAETLPLRWLLIAALLLPLLWWLSRAPTDRFVIGWGWRRTGAAVGVLALGAWVLSGLVGRNFGLSFTQPAVSLTRWLLTADARGISIATFMFVGVPFGALLAAALRKEASWSLPDARTLVRQSGGGLTMGLGASLAGGCNIGHGVAGIATLGVGSIVGVLSIMLGCWTMTAVVFHGANRSQKPDALRPA